MDQTSTPATTASSTQPSPQAPPSTDDAAPIAQDTPPVSEQPAAQSVAAQSTAAASDSYVRLAMRNMVRKGGQSIRHFLLTITGLLGLLIGLAYLTR